MSDAGTRGAAVPAAAVPVPCAPARGNVAGVRAGQCPVAHPISTPQTRPKALSVS